MLMRVPLLIGAVAGAGLLVWGPSRLRAAYNIDVTRELARHPMLVAVTETDLAALPPPVQRYLRAAGVIGQPRVANFRVRLHGRIRSGIDSRWMPLRAEQYNFVERRQRFFYLTSSMFGVPVQGYHRYADGSASMDIKLAGLVRVAHAAGDGLLQSETVTLLNDMCLFAPATLLDKALAWEEIDSRHVGVTFTNAGVTVRGLLTFNDTGELIDFVSDDRYQTSPDGRRMTRLRWSTPVTRHGRFGPMHLISTGEGRWHAQDGSFVYIELKVDDVAYNVSVR
jgi:hypothetical protein